jgi:parallel beta-helix repeat protein
MWGIAIEGSTDCIMSNNFIQVISTVGIDIAEGNSIPVNTSQRNLITSNIVRGANTGIQLLGGHNNVIAGNEIAANDIGIKVDTNYAVTLYGNVIESNSIYGTATGPNKCSIFVTTPYVDGLIVRDNFIYSSGQYGIAVQGGTSISIDSNKVQNTQKEGIYVTGGNSIYITNNEIVNAGLAASATYDAISVTASIAGIDKCIVARNIVDDTTGSPTARVAVAMLGTGSVFTNTQVYDNVLAYGGQTYVYLNPDTIYGKSVPRVLTSTANAITTSYLNDDELITINLTEATTISAPNNRRDGQRVTFVIIQGGAGGYNVTWSTGYFTQWVDTGNTVGKVATVTFVVANGLALTQESFTGYM